MNTLDLSFICLPENLIKNIEKILENYQISVNQYLSGRYVEEYSTLFKRRPRAREATPTAK